MPSVLFLDLSTKTGFAYDDPARPGVPIFGTIRLEPDGNDYGRLYDAYVNRHLIPLIQKASPDILGFEAPLTIQASRFTRTSTHVARMLFGLSAITDFVAAANGIPAVETNIQDLKKYLTGDRFAKKDAMMARCRAIGWPIRNDNEADACAGWAFVKAIRDKKFTPTSLEVASAQAEQRAAAEARARAEEVFKPGSTMPV